MALSSPLKKLTAWLNLFNYARFCCTQPDQYSTNLKPLTFCLEPCISTVNPRYILIKKATPQHFLKCGFFAAAVTKN